MNLHLTHPLHAAPRTHFADDERRLLLNTPGIGQGVIDRIEKMGVCTLQQLDERGIDTVVDEICQGVGNLAWRNRRRPLARALERSLAGLAAGQPD